ncbi:MAG: hypothetical protein IBX57_08900 [Gammaproteobacteria bacterium]|nr:hypothetical protein [Gammaproteobacteria bacterium]
MKLYLIMLFVVISQSLSSIANAVILPPVSTEPIYFEPPIVEVTDTVRQMSCVTLDNTIRYLHPYRYSYKPEFYQDESNQLATAFIMFDSVPVIKGLFGFVYLGYSSLVEEKEQRRILLIEQQISMLQQVKAEKHCFE